MIGFDPKGNNVIRNQLKGGGIKLEARVVIFKGTREVLIGKLDIVQRFPRSP